jgi:hypothetical protein
MACPKSYAAKPTRAFARWRVAEVEVAISWSQLLKKTFEIDIVCPRCTPPIRLIA